MAPSQATLRVAHLPTQGNGGQRTLRRLPLAGEPADFQREREVLLSGYSLVALLSNKGFSLGDRLREFSRGLADLLGEARVSVRIMNGVMIEETSSSRSFDANFVKEMISLGISVGKELFGVLEIESSRPLTEVEKAFLQKIPEQIGNSVQATEEIEKLRELAFTDELTGLPNRRAFLEGVHRRLEEAREKGEPLCLMILDVDGLKAINDSHGHEAGHAALRLVADALRQLPEGSLFARCGTGSDEFFALVKGGWREAGELAKRIHAFLRQRPLEFGEVSVSIGIAEFNGVEDFSELAKRADGHMYAMKRKERKAGAA